MLGYAHWTIGCGVGRNEVHVEVDLGILRCGLGWSNKPGIAVLQHGEENRVRGMHAHGHAADFNDEAETFDFGG